MAGFPGVTDGASEDLEARPIRGQGFPAEAPPVAGEARGLPSLLTVNFFPFLGAGFLLVGEVFLRKSPRILVIASIFVDGVWEAFDVLESGFASTEGDTLGGVDSVPLDGPNRFWTAAVSLKACVSVTSFWAGRD